VKLIVELDDTATQEDLYRVLDLLSHGRPVVRSAVLVTGTLADLP